MKRLFTFACLAGIVVARLAAADPAACAQSGEQVTGAYTATVATYDAKGTPLGKVKLAKSGVAAKILQCEETLNLVQIALPDGGALVWLDRAEVKTDRDPMAEKVVCTAAQVAQKVDTTQPTSAGSGGKRCAATATTQPPPK